MYKIDLLRQIEANTRGGSLSDCYSKYDLWRMIERNTRVPFVPTKNWRVNYTGQGYVEIPEWKGDEIDMLVVWNGVTNHHTYIYDSTNAMPGQSRLHLAIVGGTGFLNWSGFVLSVTVNGEKYKANSRCLPEGVESRIVVKTIESGAINAIGGKGGARAFSGSITNIKLTKADGSDNRHYESIIKSDTKPTTLTLVDSLSSVRADSEFINASTYPSHYAPITKNRLQWQNGSTDGKLINFPLGEEWTEILND